MLAKSTERDSRHVTDGQEVDFETPGQLLLYVGLSDTQSLDSTLIGLHPALKKHILAFDIRREPDHNILEGQLYDQLRTHAWKGELRGAGGGPILSDLEHLEVVPKTRRKNRGLPMLQPHEKEDADNDSLLLLRLMVLAHIIQLKFRGPGLPWCFLEHPEDPKLCSKSPNASRCSTIWQTQAVRSWCQSLGLASVHFDQCDNARRNPLCLPRISHCAIGQVLHPRDTQETIRGHLQ